MEEREGGKEVGGEEAEKVVVVEEDTRRGAW